MPKARPSLDILKSLLSYDPDSGAFTWLVSRGSASEGARAGHVKAKGYRHIGIDGVYMLEHHLAWLFVHGEWPSDQLDHKDGNRSNNRIGNLRPCSNAQNCQNRARRADNSSGFVGVTWHKPMGKWLAQLKLQGKNFNLGYFEHAADAHAAYLAAKAQRHAFQPAPR